MVDNVATDANTRGPLVIGGGFNEWATELGSKHTNVIGRRLLETFAFLQLGMANNGVANTYRKAGMGSVIAITFASFSFLPKVKWWVSEGLPYNDHQSVVFEIKEHRMTQNLKLDKDAFDLVMNSVHRLNEGEGITASNLSDKAGIDSEDTVPAKIEQSYRINWCSWLRDHTAYH